MDCQLLFHWPTNLFTYYEDFFNHIKNEIFDEIKTSLENLWQRMIQSSEFFQYSFLLILKRKCLVGASRVRCGESGTPSTIIYTRWSSRRYELGCDAPVSKTTSGHYLHYIIAHPNIEKHISKQLKAPALWKYVLNEEGK